MAEPAAMPRQPGSASPEVSVVVPMLDAEDRVEALHRALAGTLEAQGLDAEVILVDDGSSDGTWAAVRGLAEADPRVRGLRLAVNVGQTGALCAGFSVARGDVVVMMDDDLEGDAAELAQLVDAIREGAEFASGWRVGPRDLVRAAGSGLYNLRLRSWGLPFHDAGCGVNGLTGELARRMAAEGWGVRQHRFKPTVAALTDRIVEVRFPVRRTEGSHQSLVGLAASWLDVEMAFGGLGRGRYVTGAIVAPLVVAVVVGAGARRGPWSRRAPRAASAAGAAGVAGAAWRVLRRRDALDRRARVEPAFVIAARVGGA